MRYFLNRFLFVDRGCSPQSILVKISLEKLYHFEYASVPFCTEEVSFVLISGSFPLNLVAMPIVHWRVKMAEEVEEQLLLRAEIFRSKLIEHFQLLDTLTDASSEEIPKYYSDEVKNNSGMKDMMRSCPNALVKFQVYNKENDATYADKRLNRIKTKNTIPLGPWAKMIVENNRVQNFLLILIISNSIVLGIQAEISNTDSSSYKELKVFLNIFDYLSLMVFILEILLKWIDGFFDFWKNGWNVFDFFVTVMSFVPELIKVASPQDANKSLKIVADNLRTFRILRSLKMVSRFAQLRIIVLTMLKALKSMAFILMLLATFMYIFAVTGTVMFTSHHKSTRGDILYKYSFSNLVKSLLTLFQLFTLDHWFEILIDLGKTSNDFFSKAYILLWICVGAFIFKNVFTGIMVMNFQNIRNEFVMQCKEHEQAIKEVERRTKLEEELARQYRSHSVSARRKSSAGFGIFTTSSAVSNSLPEISEDEEEEGRVNEAGGSDASAKPIDQGPSRHASISVPKKEDGLDDAARQEQIKQRLVTLQEQLRKHVADHGEATAASAQEDTANASSEGNLDQPNDEVMTSHLDADGITREYKASAFWNNTITANLQNLKNSTSEVLWPRDSLFRYFQLMETLQDNLAERSQLQKLAALTKSIVNDKWI
ncbi:cation channel sperm-associated protein 2-like isoform X2 [Rhopilema esculentum]|uniref:cation channel sperm-associated protein 2-like isoform X2 n=1 Tax=Rhopilema esculentum TaxID=499914 RepID=UPI0031E2BC7F